MSLDNTRISGIATLARLPAHADKLDRYRHDLEAILGLVEQLVAVDTADIAPLAHPLELTARLRPDVVVEPDSRDRFQRLAPATGDGHYLVPKVIE